MSVGLASWTIVASPGRARAADALECYTVIDPLPLAAVLDVATVESGLQLGCSVTSTRVLCTPAASSVVSARNQRTGAAIAPLALSPAPVAGDRVCYKMDCPAPVSPAPDQQVTDEFGTRMVGRLVPTLFCTAASRGASFCGDGMIDAGESCDGTNLGGATCATLGYSGGGTLACAPGCTWDTSGCTCAPAPTCGNGVRDGVEQCDGADLGGATCASLGYTLGGTLGCTAGCGWDTSRCASQALPATGQMTCWDTEGFVVGCAGTGQDGAVRAGAALAYLDNGDGTITDLNTGLVWEKKSDDRTIHDKDLRYTWADAVNVHVAGLNAAGFGGHSDWRLPNVKELESIVDYEHVSPSISSPFNTGCRSGCTVLGCSCTQPTVYWSSTSTAAPDNAWSVLFYAGNIAAYYKDEPYHVRAVRGPS